MHRSIDDSLSNRPRNKPDYFVEKFNYVKMALNGQPRYDISGAKMVHFPITDSFEVELPVITTLDPANPPMTLRSQRAVIEDDNSKIHMYGDVQRQPRSDGEVGKPASEIGISAAAAG